MAKKNISNPKKDHAKLLYTKDGVTSFNELAKRTGASSKSISRWANEGNWETYRNNMLLTREEQMHNLLNELKQLNEKIKTKPEGEQFADSKEADVRRKLIIDIKALETKASVAEIIETARRYVKWLSLTDLNKAKEATESFDAFIKDCLK